MAWLLQNDFSFMLQIFLHFSSKGVISRRGVIFNVGEIPTVLDLFVSSNLICICMLSLSHMILHT